MGYRDYLREMLRPVGVYDLDSGVGGAELTIAGRALDELFASLETAEAESIIATAEGTGLRMYEQLLPYGTLNASAAARRKAIAALLLINESSFTVRAIAATLAGAGLDVEVTEGENPQTVTVSFPDVYGAPENFDAVKSRIESILPCHLGVDYRLRHLTWAELEAAFASWADLDGAGLAWAELEILH